MTVYIVTAVHWCDGQDFSILGVFQSKESAEKYMSEAELTGEKDNDGDIEYIYSVEEHEVIMESE
jgi:hypothetical protein